MKETRNYHLWPTDSSIMPGIRALISFLERRNRRLCLDAGMGTLCFSTPDGRMLTSKSISEVAPALEKMPFPRSWTLFANAPKADEPNHSASLTIFIEHEYSGTLISVGSEDIDLVDAVFRQIEAEFGFQRLPPGIERIRRAPHATALIGCHFDDSGKRAGQRLQRFLSLIGFARVDIADTVRAAPIQDKVRDLLDRNSFYVGIVTGHRDHAWISAESAYVIAKNKEVVLVIQKGVDFDPTLYGRDREHITFTNTVDEAFVGLLEDFRSRSVLGLM